MQILYSLKQEKKKKWARQHLLDLISSIEISPSPRPYYGQIQEPDVCIKKKKISLESVWLFIQFSPCHPDLGYVQQSPNNKLECSNFSLQKRSRRGEVAPHQGTRERSLLCEKWDKRHSFYTKSKTSFLSSGPITLRSLLFSMWRQWLWTTLLWFHYTKGNV